MSLCYICIEMRKNLRCANVFLQFDHSLTETEFLKINVDEDAITLREYSTATRVSVVQHFTIQARTISNLTVEECNASFRLTIDIDCGAEDEMPQAAINAIGIKPQVEEKIAVTLLCGNCKCDLTGAQSYQRIREFPSGSIDINELFCHHGPKYDEVLVPRLDDLFYGFQFIVLNEQRLHERVKAKESHLYCGRCLQNLGELLFEGKAAKLWGDTLLLQNDVEELKQTSVFNWGLRKPTSQLLNKLIDETTVSIAEPLLQQIHFSKVLLEAAFPNRERKYLLLHILEKQLQVLRNAKPLAHGSHNNNNVLQVQLERYKAFKLLYRFMDEATSALGQTEDEGGGGGGNVATNDGGSVNTLLNSWKHDMSIHFMIISPTLFSALLEELEENSMLLPELYRFTHDNFQLSYVFYKD